MKYQSPEQAALLRGFARKKLQEEEGTYSPLMVQTRNRILESGTWNPEP